MWKVSKNITVRGPVNLLLLIEKPHAAISRINLRNCSSNIKDSYNSDDYQILHRSDVPTMHFQKTLLRLKIPELEKTCSRYLRSQKVILSEDEYSSTEKIVMDFQKNEGPQLQSSLINYDKANKHTNYISKPWFDMYLSDRASVVLNYNPFLAFHPVEGKLSDPVLRATNVLISSMRFMNTLRKQILKPEVYHLNPAKSNTTFYNNVIKWTPSALASYASYAFKAFPLDMSQFKNLFNSTRIPHKGKDIIQDFPESKHMLIMKNGNFFIFDLYDDQGQLYSAEHIHSCVSYIYSDQTPRPEYPIGILTSENRDTWATLRDELIQSGNEESLRMIDSAAFNMVFDGAKVGTDPDKFYRTFLYGDGGNRWFDKSFSLIFTSDGMAGLNFEHSWGDGVAILRYFTEMVQDHTEKPRIHPSSNPRLVDASKFVKKLDFKLTDSLKSSVSKAFSSYKERTERLNVDVFESDVFGKNLCKKHKVSPDAIMQMGFQVAYYLQNGKAAATYESCSTSAFKHGRTETIRPATLETLAFAKALSQPEGKRPDVAQLKKALHDCSTMHGQLTKEAAMGQGFDRHLFGLKMMSSTVPSLMKDPNYAKINHNIISTSTLPSNLISIGGFAPVVPDGFGLGYQIKDDTCGMVLSSYPESNNGKQFIECASKSYQMMRDILTKT